MTILVQGKPDIVAGLIKDLPNLRDQGRGWGLQPSFRVQPHFIKYRGEAFSIVGIDIPDDLDIDDIDDYAASCIETIRTHVGVQRLEVLIAVMLARERRASTDALVDGCTELASALATLPSGLLEIVADAARVAGQKVTGLYKWPSIHPLYLQQLGCSVTVSNTTSRSSSGSES